MRLRYALIASLLLLTACDSTQSLVKLRHAPPTTDAFSAALASNYHDYANEKLANYAWWTSKYFADKGLLAAYGRDVAPEDVANWSIAPTQQAEFEDARAQLMAALPAAKTAQPGVAAAAMVAYDRWLVLTDNAWNTPAIEDARDQFFTQLGKLSSSEHAAATDDTALTGMGGPIETTSTILYFPFDSAELGDAAGAAIAQLVAYVKEAGNVSITINGHADRAGGDDYNMTLSQHRAEFIQQALIKAGVSEKLVNYFAFGETDPDVPTDDGVQEPLNRRVEIYIE